MLVRMISEKGDVSTFFETSDISNGMTVFRNSLMIGWKLTDKWYQVKYLQLGELVKERAENETSSHSKPNPIHPEIEVPKSIPIIGKELEKPKENEVFEWLKSIKMEKYQSEFDKLGVQTLEDLKLTKI